MPLLVDRTFSQTDVFIPNLSESCVGTNIDYLITEKEIEALCLTLGYCIYEQLRDQLEFSEDKGVYVLKDNTEDKWKWLLYGHTYDKPNDKFGKGGCGCGCSKTECLKLRWSGIIKSEMIRIPTHIVSGIEVEAFEMKSSYLWYYIYYHYTLQSQTLTTGTGEQSADVKGLTRVSNHRKGIYAYNNFVAWVTRCKSNCEVSLNRFMSDHCDLFPEWERNCFKYKSLW